MGLCGPPSFLMLGALVSLLFQKDAYLCAGICMCMYLTSISSLNGSVVLAYSGVIGGLICVHLISWMVRRTVFSVLVNLQLNKIYILAFVFLGLLLYFSILPHCLSFDSLFYLLTNSFVMCKYFVNVDYAENLINKDILIYKVNSKTA